MLHRYLSCAYLSARRNRAKTWFLIACAGLLVFATCAADAVVPRTARVIVTPQSGDTLHFSPFAHAIVDSWDADSLTPPRFFCVASYATWPGYVYVRHMFQRPVDLQCTPSTPLFIQAQACPKDQIMFAKPTGAPWIVVQCGKDRFESYKLPGTGQPQTDGREEA